MRAPWRKNNKRFNTENKARKRFGQQDKTGRNVFSVALFVLLVSFVGGCISTYIMYRKSVNQVFETRVEHVRSATSYLGRSLDANSQATLASTKNAGSKEYLSTKKVLTTFLRDYPTARRAYTLLVKNGDAIFLVDARQATRKASNVRTTSPIGMRLKAPSKELLDCSRRGVPTVERTTRSDVAGIYVCSYFPLKSKDGKVRSVLAVDMEFNGYQEDCDALLEALEYGLYATCVMSVLLAIFAVGFMWAYHRDNLDLTNEVVEHQRKLHETQNDLVQAVSASEEISGSLIYTLNTAGCLVWYGQAWKSNGRILWKGDLKYEPHFEWLIKDIKAGANFEEAWEARRNQEDRLVWEKLLGFAFDSRLASLNSEYRVNDDDEDLWFEEQLEFDYEPDGSISIHGFVRDITDSKRRHDEIRRLAYYDTVTGLINRARINDVINELLDKGRPVGLIGVEIGNFRNVNESWGAEVADLLLQQFGAQLSEGVGTHGIVGRIAGDDFVIIVPDEPSMSWLLGKVDEICQKPTYIDGVEIAKICRLGYISSMDGDNAATMLRKVNLALENARKNLTNFPVAYKPEMSFKAKMRVELETAMRQALVDREFYLMFQPIYCNKTGKLVKAEALLRWNSSRFGAISPSTFIPIAEESDFINDLGNYVIDEAARAINNFAEQTGNTSIVLSLNMSLRQLKNQSTLNVFHSALDRWGISQRNMLIEITESSIMHDSGECIAMLTQLQERGFSLAIDDFGTGYSSLATLASLPFDCLKIDKRFVDGIGVDKKQEEVLETIVRLARALNLQIVAEGIEKEAQFHFLRDLGVEFSQGFYFARPLAFEELVARAKVDGKKAA